MIAITESAEPSIILDGPRQSRFMSQVSVAIGDRTRATIRVMSEKLERRFAAFAGVPYHDPLDLAQWEQLWEADSSLSGSLGAKQIHGKSYP
jgi:hypothetical protein